LMCSDLTLLYLYTWL